MQGLSSALSHHSRGIFNNNGGNTGGAMMAPGGAGTIAPAKDFFKKKSARKQPKMLANNIIQSIKVDGRTKMIV